MRSRFPQAPWMRVALLFAVGVLAGCAEDVAPDDKTQSLRTPNIPEIVPANEVLSGAHVPGLDPATMNGAEIAKALGEGPRCEFRYTSSGRPVLAVQATPDIAAASAVVKLNGDLVVLETSSTEAGLVLIAEPVRLAVEPEPGGEDDSEREASVLFEVADSLRVGYRGYYECFG